MLIMYDTLGIEGELQGGEGAGHGCMYTREILPSCFALT